MFPAPHRRSLAQTALPGAIVAVLAMSHAGSLHAEDEEAVQLAQLQQPSSLTLPRFDGDGIASSTRIEMPLAQVPRSGVGLSLGVTTLQAGPGVPALGPRGSSLDLGLRWRHVDDHVRFDVSAWRSVGSTPFDAASLIQSRDPSPTYGARVEMGFGSATKKGFIADRGFLGVQLESGARITVKRSGGRPMLYYRNKF